MFHTILLEDIPSGEMYQMFRMLLLQTVQNVTAGHWNLNNENKDIVMIMDKDAQQFLDYLNRQLRTYRASLGHTEGKQLTMQVLDS
jgi:hypothetical protein